MLAIYTAVGGPISNYTIIASDQADDIYVRQTVDNGLQVANNSSFINVPLDPNYLATSAAAADILYVTNGRPAVGPGPMYRGDNRSDPLGPGYQADAVTSSTTFFSLSNGNINRPRYDLDDFGYKIPIAAPPVNALPSERFQVSKRIHGEVQYDADNDGTPEVWQFELDPDGPMVFRQIGGTEPAPVRPVSGAITTGEVTRLGRGEGLRGTLTLAWSSPVATVPDVRDPANPPGWAPPPVVTRIDYTYDNVADELDGGQSLWTDVELVPSSTQIPGYKFDIDSGPLSPGEIEGGIIAGTVSGTIVFDDDVIGGNAATPANKGLGRLTFRTDYLGGSTLYFGSLTFGDIDWLRVSGTIQGNFDAASGQWFATIDLSFANRYATRSALAGEVGVNPGTVRIEGVDFLRYVQDPNPNSFTVFAGHDLTSQVNVDYDWRVGHGTAGSTVNIDSDVATATPNASSNIGDFSITATNVNVSAQLVTQDRIAVTAETVLVDAPVVAPERFDFSVGDEPGGPSRGRLQLSPSGSLSGALAPTVGSVSTPTGVINVLATQADVYAEGIVYGTKQDWLMRSTQYVTGLAPYEFTTRSPATGVDTGLIRGGSVAIVLGNDAPTPLDGSIAYNTLDLNTQVDSLRIKASTRQDVVGALPPSPSPSGPFPYKLSIREKDDISIDAVAASGLPLTIQSGGNMRFSSALATAGDVTLQALSTDSNPSRLTVSAPLSTSKGKIRLVADGVAINNSLGVTSADEDEYRDDIWITASAGDILLNGLVAAVNRVKIEQFNPLGPTITPYFNRNPRPLPDVATVTQTIQVTDDFSFDNLDVEVDLTHTFVGDLTGTLIAPDGRRFRLFDRNGGSGDNFTGTIFDSEAPNSIAQGVAPFTGSFRPVDSLAPLYGGSSLGTWRLEIRDNAGGDVGTLTNFTLRFQTLEPQAAKVFGPARIVADVLLLDVQGEVGNSKLLPTDTNFFLRTDVTSLTGSVGNGASIDELNDIDIPSLRAGGLVSLRANGVDPTSGANAGNAALRARLVDITGLDVAAPSGSVDVLFDTSRKIELGNAAGLRTGRSLNSVAAGDVTIRSTAGSIVALDAPVAGGNARGVRVATTVPLATASNGQALSLVAYSAGNPGVIPGALRGRGNLNAWFGVQVQPLRVGDRVLVKNQVNTAENGVYAVSFMSTATWTPTTTWTLTRAADSDTAAEFPGNSFVRVGEQQAGAVNQVGTWQITANYIPLLGATAIVTVPVPSGNAAITLGSSTDVRDGMVVFGPGIAANTTVSGPPVGSTITLSQPTTGAIGNGDSLKFVAPAVTRTGTTGSGLDDVFITGLSATSDLQAGMLVIGDGIPSDTVITRIVNATTVVISKSATAAGVGQVNFIRPFATRTATTNATTSVTVQSTTGDLLVGMIVVGEGIPADTTIAAIDDVTKTITLSRAATVAGAGVSLKFLAATPTNFGRAPIAVAQKAVTTDIGSDNPNSTVTFVVSTNAGTNSAAGSLGKMISLRQQNSAKLGNDTTQLAGSQLMDFRFSASIATDITPIRLTQELPEITKAFTIGGSPTYPGTPPAGSKAAPLLIDGSRITQTRSGRNVVAGDIVSGLVVSGAEASGAVIRNVNLGGFSRAAVSGGSTQQSAAIDVRDAAGVLVQNVTLGVSELGVRLSNGVGVRFTGAATKSGTLLNSTVLGSNDSGLVVENDASGISVVGSTFGKADIFNGVGATLGSGINQFGVDPMTPVQPIPQGQATRVATNRFSLPATFLPYAWRLVPGLQILSPTVTPSSGNARATISAVATNATTGVTTVTVAGGSVTGNGPVAFVAVDPSAIPDALATRVENRFTLPNPQASGVTAGTVVSGSNIRLAAGSTRATVAPISMNGVTTFEIAGGTVIGDGAVTFGSGSTRFVLSVTKVVDTFTLSPAVRNVSALLYAGLGLTGPTIQVDASPVPDTVNMTPASISALARNQSTGVTTVTITGGRLTGSGAVSFGHVVYTELNGRGITLPSTVNMDNLFLGQIVRGTGIAGDTTITAIDRVARTVTFAENRLMTRTGFSVISFGVGGRNTVTQNRTGLILAGGATTVTNSTIFANTFNGIEIRGSGWPLGAPAAFHRVGTAVAPSVGSNQIHSNQGWGIFYTSAVSDDVKTNRVRIEGNFLGTTSLAVVPSTLANKKGNIGHFTTREEVFRGLAGRLVPRAVDGLDGVNNQHGRYQGPGGGGGSGNGGVR